MILMFQYLIYTLLIELPVVLYCYFKQWKTALIVDLLLNLFTWPLLTICMNYTNIPLLLLEIMVFIIEAIGFKIFFNGNWQKALLVSLAANSASLIIGILITGNTIQLW